MRSRSHNYWKSICAGCAFLVNMTVRDKSERSTDSVRTDQTGKVFIALGQGVRQCLICEGLFTRRAAFEHSLAPCAGNQYENLLKMMQIGE